MTSRSLLWLIGVGFAALTHGELLDELGQDSLQKAFSVIREKAIQGDSLTAEELNRAALQGLVQRLEFGAELGRGAEDEAEEASEILSEVIPDDIGYVRVPMRTADEVKQLRGALEAMSKSGVEVVILDLRSDGEAGAFEIAAGILDCFLPAGEALFGVRKRGAGAEEGFVSKRPASWAGDLFVIVGSRTNANGEAVAAVVADQVRGTLVGAKTRGAAVRYDRIEIGEGAWIQVPTAEVVLAGSGSFYREGVDVAWSLTEASPEDGASLLKKMNEEGVASVVEESQRPRFNEAALVAGTDPGMEYRLARGRGEESKYDQEILMDRGLQQLVDLIVTRRFLGQDVEAKEKE